MSTIEYNSNLRPSRRMAPNTEPPCPTSFKSKFKIKLACFLTQRSIFQTEGPSICRKPHSAWWQRESLLWSQSEETRDRIHTVYDSVQKYEHHQSSKQPLEEPPPIAIGPVINHDGERKNSLIYQPYNYTDTNQGANRRGGEIERLSARHNNSNYSQGRNVLLKRQVKMTPLQVPDRSGEDNGRLALIQNKRTRSLCSVVAGWCQTSDYIV